MNLGGDGYDTHPFLAPERTPYFKTHFDISKLDQWDQVLNHAQTLLQRNGGPLRLPAGDQMEHQ